MKKIYVMQDTVSEQLGELFTCANDREARRQFMVAAGNITVPDYVIKDSILLCVGEFYDEDKRCPHLNSYATPDVVIRGTEVDVDSLRAQSVQRNTQTSAEEEG